MISTVLVEGIGDATDRFYEPALRKFKAEKGKALSVWFADMNSLWKGKPSLGRKREDTIKRFSKWGGKYLDKSNKGDYEKYRKLASKEIDVILVAVDDAHHVEVAEYWLESNCKQIFVEKPLDRNYEAAMRLTGKVRPDDYRVRVFDHYRARVHDKLRHSALRDGAILDPLGGQLKKLSFYLLEDHSGTDEKFDAFLKSRGRPQRHGPIESEDRVSALDAGLILDLMPHMPALVYYFGYIDTIHPYRITAGIYRGVDNVPTKKAEINGETFAHINFRFFDHRGNSVEGEASIGKGVRGSRNFPTMAGNTKALLLEGSNGKEFLFDLRNDAEVGSKGYLRGDAGEQTHCEFEHDPYWYLLKEIDEGTSKGVDLGLPLITGVGTLEVLQRMRFPLRGLKKSNIPVYDLKMKDSGLAPYLEDLLEGPSRLETLYGI
jgi:predicted dehydrogenase